MKAIDKLTEQLKAGKYDRYANAMKQSVYEALREFCRQDEEFAEAVEQGGSFADCMKAVAKGCGTSLSDLEAYRRAVSFYFEGATVVFQMKIDVTGAEPEKKPEEKPEKKQGIILDLGDFL